MAADNAGPMVSVITITYNAAQTLERTIVSVEAQDYKAIEYIIVDGGSTDGTMQIVGRHERSISRCISEPDDGIYFAMNKGLAAATGEYVWFLNAGDEFHSPSSVSDAMSAAAGADVVYGDTVVTAADGSVIGGRRLEPPERLTADSFRDGMLVCHQAFVPRRSICPPYDTSFRFSADYDWCLKILLKARSVVNARQVLVRFLDGGFTKSHIAQGLRERFAIMSRQFGLAPTLARHLLIAARFFRFWIAKGRF